MRRRGSLHDGCAFLRSTSEERIGIIDPHADCLSERVFRGGDQETFRDAPSPETIVAKSMAVTKLPSSFDSTITVRPS